MSNNRLKQIVYIGMLLLVTALQGCASQNTCTRERTQLSIQTETKFIHTHSRDTFFIEKTNNEFQKNVTQANDTNRLSNTYCFAEAWLDHRGQLFLLLQMQPEIKVKGLIYEKEIHTEKEKDTIVHENTTQTVNILTKWQRWQKNGFWVLLALNLVVLTFYIQRKKLKN